MEWQFDNPRGTVRECEAMLRESKLKIMAWEERKREAEVFDMNHKRRKSRA